MAKRLTNKTVALPAGEKGNEAPPQVSSPLGEKVAAAG